MPEFTVMGHSPRRKDALEMVTTSAVVANAIYSAVGARLLQLRMRI